MQQVSKFDGTNQWATGSGWGQSKGQEDNGWNQGPSDSGSSWTSASNRSAWSSEDASDSRSNQTAGSLITASSSNNTDQNLENNQASSAMTNMSASISWGANPSTSGGLETNLWGMTTPTSSSASTLNPGWGSTSLSAGQGHNMQIGASSMGGDNHSSDSSASAGGWGVSAMSQNGSSVPPNSAQTSQTGVISGNLQTTAGSQQSGPSALISSQSGPFGSKQMPWQTSKMFSFPPTSDSSWSTPSSIISSNGSASKEQGATMAAVDLEGHQAMAALAEAGKMDLAAGLANLSIDKTAPPPDVSWNAAKVPWNSSLDPTKVPGAGVVSAAESFAQATQKGLKSHLGETGIGPALSARDEEIRRAIDTHEGWGTRPVRQDTSWDVENSPKASRKVQVDTSNAGASNVWNNNNGTAIWEAVREPQPQGWGGGAAAGGGNAVFGEKDPSSWNMMPKPNIDSNNWVGAGSSSVSDKSIGTWGTENQSSKLWGSKTETGSWGEPSNGRSSGLTWGSSDNDVGTWEDPSTASRRIISSGGGGGGGGGGGSGSTGGNGGMSLNSSINPVPNAPTISTSGMGVADSSMYWSDPNAKPQSWNPPPAMIRPKPEEPWNKPQGVMRPGNGGWGDPSGSGAQKVDDGTSIWAANAQEQARAGGWGEPSSLWNPAVGARPKSTSWGESPDTWNLNRKPGWTDEERSNGWGDSVEVGYWNDVAQESSSWSSAPSWKSGRSMMVKQGQPRLPSGSNQPQMRSKLIQQLMDMGFKKEEAQTALINNNMNFESALGELTSGIHKKDLDNDVFPPNGAKLNRPGFLPDNVGNLVGDDISDTRSESNPHVPNFPMQNTPFPNAQVPNQPFISGPVNMYDRSKGGPPMPPSNSSSINTNLQQKLKHLQQQGSMPAGINSLSPTQGVVTRSTLPGATQTMVQQQAAQQQILQQLRLAVQSGLISPQLLNQQLPHNILVMLQQLLQLQNALQNLLQRQQFMQQNKVTLSIPRPQIDQVTGMIAQYKSQIVSLQKQLQQAQQQMLLKQPPAPTPTPQPMQQPPMIPPPAAPSSMQSEGSDNLMSLHGDMANMAQSASASMQSRLTQWKRPTPERDGEGRDLNKAPGSKPLQHSHSAPMMGPFGDLTGLNISGDTTWSSAATTTGSTSWPSTSMGEGGGLTNADIKGEREELTPTNTSISVIGGSGSLGLSDVIPEFVPGKPWQGLSKSVEDDPHITPGSISRSLSVNVVKEERLYNLTANKPSPALGTDSEWSMKDVSKLGGSMVDTCTANSAVRATPGLTSQSNSRTNQWSNSTLYNRQHSWGGARSAGSAFTQVGSSGWDGRQSSPWLMLKNLTPQIDAGMLRTLCQQHGPLLWFSFSNSQALVQYTTKEAAGKAQRVLHGCNLGNTVIHVEQLAEEEVSQLLRHQQSTDTQVPPPTRWSQPATATSPHSSADPWNSAPPLSAPPLISGGGTMWGSSLWDIPGGDHGSTAPVLSNILGGELI